MTPRNGNTAALAKTAEAFGEPTSVIADRGGVLLKQSTMRTAAE
jgi:hypothetical protein